MPPLSRSPGRLVRAALARALLLALLGWGIAEGEVESAPLAALAVGAGVLASLALAPPGDARVRWRGLLRFVPYFLWQAARAGSDVALRALHPRLPIAPGFVEYPLRLPGQGERVFFADALSLLPGTLGVELRRDSVRVHVLDRETAVHERLRELEARVAAVFSRGEREGGRP